MPKFDRKEVSVDEYIVDEIRFLRADIRRMNRQNDKNLYKNMLFKDELLEPNRHGMCARGVSEADIDVIINQLKSTNTYDIVEKIALGTDHFHIMVLPESDKSRALLRSLITSHRKDKGN